MAWVSAREHVSSASEPTASQIQGKHGAEAATTQAGPGLLESHHPIPMVCRTPSSLTVWAEHTLGKFVDATELGEVAD